MSALGVVFLVGCGLVGIHDHAGAGVGEPTWLRRAWYVALAVPWVVLVGLLVTAFAA